MTVLVNCYACRARPAAFTIDTPADGMDVCAACLPAALEREAQYGHEWTHVFPGQYPRYLKVTPLELKP